LKKIPNEPRAEVSTETDPEAKEARLRYRVLGATPLGSWLEIELETGRMHQIRVQAAARGHFVLGDAQYGSKQAFGPVVDDIRSRAIALHGRILELNHPMTRDRISVTAPLPAYWTALDARFAEGNPR
jgi:23S rRNA pseudouridine1911/1915/1917 synthase